METAAEVVVAAEALRTWVRTQREGWKAPHPAMLAPTPVRTAATSPAPGAPVHVPAPVETPRPTSAPQPPSPAAPAAGPRAAAPPVIMPRTPADGPPSALVVPAVVAASSGAVASQATHAPVATHTALFERHVAPDDDAVSAPMLGRTWVRAVLVVAAVIVLATGAFLLRGRTGNLAPAPKSGTAVLTSEPAGAAVTIDGKASGTTPLTLNLPVGKHELEFRLKAATRKQSVEIAGGKQTSVDIDWNARPLGSLRVEARPTPARVLVDGKDRGEAPLTLTDLTVGTHTVQIDTMEGSVRRKVEIAQGRTESLIEEIFPGWLHVSSPIELTVVDGRKSVQLDASNRVLLKPGVHTIRLENRTLEIAETRQVTIEPGGTAKVNLDPQESTLSVVGSSGADVFIDGSKVGETPLADFKVRLGSHDVMVVDRGGATRHATVTVTARPATLDIPFQKP